MSNFAIFYPSPQDVEFRLKEAGWKYINNRAGDFTYAQFAAIPALFEYVVECKRVPPLLDLAKHLWQFRAKGIRTDKDIELAKGRTRKLVQDFYRELHTFGLLAQSTIFGSVRYAKVEDITLGVDYTAVLSLAIPSNEEAIGIQAAMRDNWTNDVFTSMKQARQNRRNSSEKWDGPIYLLTDKHRSHVSLGGVWLFTQDHVNDLMYEIIGNNEVEDVAIQTELAE